MEKEKLLAQAKKLCLDTDKTVIESLAKEKDIMEAKLEKFKKINVDNIAPMTRPIDTPITFLREDVIQHESKKDVILSNAPKSDKDFVLLEKVVKND